MDTASWALVVGWVAVALALACFCITIYVILSPPRDQDVEELADEVARLTRRARADTMRRVRAEAKEAPPDGVADFTVPPELQARVAASSIARDPRAMKHAIRQRLLGGNGGAS